MSLPQAAQRVQELLNDLGTDAEVLEFPSGTRTVAEAAASIGVDEGQIAKSLLFMAGEKPVLAVLSGRYRVNTKLVKRLMGASVRQARAEEVRSETGYVIGGVAPLGHVKEIHILLDEHLWDYPLVYAAAGTPHCAFAITPDELLRISGGQRVAVSQAMS